LRLAIVAGGREGKVVGSSSFEICDNVPITFDLFGSFRGCEP
jgi:hypothetical protein